MEITYILGLQPFMTIWDKQKEMVDQIDRGERRSHLLLLEHEHVYTLGRAGNRGNVLISDQECDQLNIALVNSDRGGDVTYHGPGQLVGYPLLRLHRGKIDAHGYLRFLEQTLIDTLADFGLTAERKQEYTGVWINDTKIAAIGVKFNRGKRCKDYITSHGFALNVHSDLKMFRHIIPCGIEEFGVTSMQEQMRVPIELEDVVICYQKHFANRFVDHFV